MEREQCEERAELTLHSALKHVTAVTTTCHNVPTDRTLQSAVFSAVFGLHSSPVSLRILKVDSISLFQIRFYTLFMNIEIRQDKHHFIFFNILWPASYVVNAP